MDSEGREPREYEPPEIVDYGDLAELTEGIRQADDPEGTSSNEPTFS